ncbi:MAG: SCO family protein [Bacteroidia bacterium]|nr:SCO family protein [Bacteroidia bacterium]
MRRTFLHITFAILAAAGVSACGDGSATTVTALPELGKAPAFTGSNFTGAEVSSDELRGTVYIAYFFFTSCSGPCPVMNSKANVLQAAYAKANDFRIVGFSVDPETDTVLRLARYADRYSAKPGRWYMLHSSIEQVSEVASAGFKVGDASEPDLHSTRFILVDRSGTIRGYYDGMDDTKMSELRGAIDFLLGRDA